MNISKYKNYIWENDMLNKFSLKAFLLVTLLVALVAFVCSCEGGSFIVTVDPVTTTAPTTTAPVTTAPNIDPTPDNTTTAQPVITTAPVVTTEAPTTTKASEEGWMPPVGGEPFYPDPIGTKVTTTTKAPATTSAPVVTTTTTKAPGTPTTPVDPEDGWLDPIK
jgi:hypothetical protein